LSHSWIDLNCARLYLLEERQGAGEGTFIGCDDVDAGVEPLGHERGHGIARRAVNQHRGRLRVGLQVLLQCLQI